MLKICISKLTGRIALGGLLMCLVASGGFAQNPDKGHRALELNPELQQHPSRVLYCFKKTIPLDIRKQIRAAFATKLIHLYTMVPGLECIEVEDVNATVRMLRNHPLIEYAEPDFVVHPTVNPNDPNFDAMWGMHNTGQLGGIVDADIDAPEAWDIFSGDPNFVVAIIDTGTQWSHPDLAANIWINPGEIAGNGIDDDGNGFIDDVRGWDFVDNDNDPNDTNGHGTHTAGTVGAVGNNGLGVTGVNWRCKIMPLRFIGPFGGFTSDAIAAINYAANKGVKVSNNSWGGGGFSIAMRNAILVSQSVGHIFVAAAGNSALNTDTFPHYPSSYDLDNIISVASTTRTDSRSSFSNFGVVSVDLGAPGSDILSTSLSNSYATLSGTSMAAPHVAGVAALVYAQNPTWTYAQVRDKILGSVDPVISLSGLTVTGGRLNALAALTTGAPQPPVADAGPDQSVVDADGSGAEIVTLDGSASFDPDGTIVAYAWTEGATLLGSTAIVNASFAVGPHTVTLTVTDDSGAAAFDTVDLTVSTAPPPSFASDDFESGNFSGGLGPWVGPWSTAGDVRIRVNSDSPHSGTTHVRIGKADGDLRRSVNLAGATGAHLTFWAKLRGLRNLADQVFVRVSSDGVNFTTVHTFFTSDNDNVYHPYDIDISGFPMTADFTIDFDSNLDKGFIFVDDIELLGSAGPVPNQPPVPNAGGDFTVVDADGSGAEIVTLDGSGSFDPDGVIVSYTWREGAFLLGSTSIVNVSLSVGLHNITLDVVDNDGAKSAEIILVTVASAPPPSLATDGFESESFSGGTGAWVGPWSTAGDVRIRVNRDGPHSGSSHVRISKQNGDLARSVNLAGAAGVHLTFWAKADQFRGKDQAFVRVSSDGVNFTTVQSFTSLNSDNIYRFYDIDLSAFALTAGFRIDFDSDLNQGFLFVDDIDLISP